MNWLVRWACAAFASALIVGCGSDGGVGSGGKSNDPRLPSESVAGPHEVSGELAVGVAPSEGTTPPRPVTVHWSALVDTTGSQVCVGQFSVGAEVVAADRVCSAVSKTPVVLVAGKLADGTNVFLCDVQDWFVTGVGGVGGMAQSQRGRFVAAMGSLGNELLLESSSGGERLALQP